jgi:hypothetical protein
LKTNHLATLLYLSRLMQGTKRPAKQEVHSTTLPNKAQISQAVRCKQDLTAGLPDGLFSNQKFG